MEQISKASQYRSYYEVARKITDDKARLAFYDAVDAYRFDGIEPEGLPLLADIAFTAIRSFLDADVGRKCGGAPSGNRNAAKPAPKASRPRPQPEPKAQTLEEPEEERFEFVEDAGEEQAENETDVRSENNPQNNPQKQPKTNDVDVDVDVDEDVDVAPPPAPPVPTPPGQPVTVTAIGNFLWDHGLALDNDGMKRMAASLVMRGLGMEFLDYAYDYLAKRPFGAVSGGKTRRFEGMSEAERNNLFFKAVTTWTDMEQGFGDSLKKKPDCGASASDPPPSGVPTCHFCGGKLQVGGGLLACRNCGGYVIHDARGWRLDPFPDVSLSQGFRDNMRKGA